MQDDFYLVTTAASSSCEGPVFYLHIIENDCQVTLISADSLSEASISWRFIPFDVSNRCSGKSDCVCNILTTRQLVYLQAANGHVICSEIGGQNLTTYRDIPYESPSYLKYTFKIHRADLAEYPVWWTGHYSSDASIPLPIESTLPDLFEDCNNYGPEIYEQALNLERGNSPAGLRLGVQETLLVEDALQCLMGVQGEFVTFRIKSATEANSDEIQFTHEYKTLAQRLKENLPGAATAGILTFDSVILLDESLQKMMSKIMDICHKINVVRIISAWHLDDPISQVNASLGNCLRHILSEFEKRVCDINSWNEHIPMSLQKLYAILETHKPFINLLENIARVTYGHSGPKLSDLVINIYHDTLKTNIKKLFVHILKAIHNPIELYLANWLQNGKLDRDICHEYFIVRNIKFANETELDNKKKGRSLTIPNAATAAVKEWFAWDYEYRIDEECICDTLKPFQQKILDIGKYQIILRELMNQLEDAVKLNPKSTEEQRSMLCNRLEYFDQTWPILDLADMNAFAQNLAKRMGLVQAQLNEFFYNDNRLVIDLSLIPQEDVLTLPQRRTLIDLKSVLTSTKELYFVKKVDLLEDMFINAAHSETLANALTSANDGLVAHIQQAWQKALCTSTEKRAKFLLPVSLTASKLPLSCISEIYQKADGLENISVKTFCEMIGLATRHNASAADEQIFKNFINSFIDFEDPVLLPLPVFEDRNLLRVTYLPEALPYPLARIIFDRESLLILQSIFRILFTITNLTFALEMTWSQIYHAQASSHQEDPLLSLAAQTRTLFGNVIKSLGDYITDEVLPNRDQAMTLSLNESRDFMKIRSDWKTNLIAIGYELFLNDTTVQQHLSGLFKLTQSFTHHIQRLIDYDAVSDEPAAIQHNVRLIENMDHSFRCMLLALVNELKNSADTDSGRAPALLARLELTVVCGDD